MLTLYDLIEICEDEGRNPRDVRIMFDPGAFSEFDIPAIDLIIEEGSSSTLRGFAPTTFVLLEDRS
jgi:hypothetical protein